MNIEDVNESDIVINTRRQHNGSMVEVRFKYNEIIISASMRCSKKLNSESDAQEKILRCLGFDEDKIQGLKYE